MSADIRMQLNDLLDKVKNLARVSDKKPSQLGECPICENIIQHRLDGVAINIVRSPTKWQVEILRGLPLVVAACDRCSYCRMFGLITPEDESEK